MKLKFSSIALLTVALILAASSAFVARSLMRPPAAPPAVVAKKEPVPEPVLVLTAAQAIKPGDFLDRSVTEWVEVPENSVHAGDIIGRSASGRRSAEQSLFGITVRETIEPGQRILDGKLLYPGSPGFISAVLSPGMRAITIPTSAVTSNAGLVSAGDWVDVILSVERTEAASISAEMGGLAQAHLAAQTILRKVRVLALNSDTKSLAPTPQPAADDSASKKKRNKHSKKKAYETITLEVTPNEAERLAVAREAGSLQVVMRSMKEIENEDETLVAENGDQEEKVTRLKDTTDIFYSRKKGKGVARVLTFQGSRAQMVSF